MNHEVDYPFLQVHLGTNCYRRQVPHKTTKDQKQILDCSPEQPF